jgi:hypothetical protein
MYSVLPERRTWVRGGGKWDVEENVWTEERGCKRKMER